jgi:hypothetical protein
LEFDDLVEGADIQLGQQVALRLGQLGALAEHSGGAGGRLRGDQGQRIWTGWAILAYNLDTLVIHTT